MRSRTSPGQVVASLLVVLVALLAVVVANPSGPVAEFVRSAASMVVLAIAAIVAVRLFVKKRGARTGPGPKGDEKRALRTLICLGAIASLQICHCPPGSSPGSVTVAEGVSPRLRGSA